MKTIITLLLLCIGTLTQAQNDLTRTWFSFPEDDINTQFGIFVDPTFTDKGFQIGLEATMVMNWGFVGAQYSTYPDLNGVGYSDLVGQLGINWHMFNTSRVRYYVGGRLGTMFRDGGPFPLVGMMGGLDYRLNSNMDSVKFYIGFKLWIDYREDQKNQFFGDDDAYERGIITNNPLLQENGALTFSVSF